MPRTPNTTYQLLSVNWDREYKNVRYFSSVSAQNSWFGGKGRMREGNQAIRFGYPYTVEGNYNTVSQYNYMRFINNQYDNAKYFYAFIDKVVYRSERTCDIYFTIDAYQSYLGEMSFGECMIVRQHTKNDSVPRTDEPIGVDDQAYLIKGNMWESVPTFIVVTSSPTEGGASRIHDTSHAIPEGFYLYLAKDASSLQTLLHNWNDKLEDVKAIYAVPRNCINDKRQSGLLEKYVASGSMEVKKPTKIGNFTPRNKKTLYYPYCYCVVSNNQGDMREFKFENVSNGGDTIKFSASGTLSTTPVFICMATNLSDNKSRYSPIFLNGAPSVSYSASFYSTYMGNNQMSIAENNIADAISIGTSLAGASFNSQEHNIPSIAPDIDGAVSGIQRHVSYMNDLMMTAKTGSNPTKIAGTAIPALFNQTMYNFTSFIVRCREAYLKKVDDFFTMYGYNYQGMGKPNPANRASYYYCQTSGAIVNGKIPQNVRTIMEHALDAGITFWKNDDIGNYSQSNN